jgi:hypothetical protein
LVQLPKKYRRGRQTLIRCDSGGGTHEFTAWLTKRGRWLSYSVGMTVTDAINQAVLQVPGYAWTAAVEPSGEIRDGAWVAELDADMFKDWPKGMRLIVRKERPHPGTQLRFTDADGMRLTCSPPTPITPRSPRWSCGTASAPTPRTASAPPAPPACAKTMHLGAPPVPHGHGPVVTLLRLDRPSRSVVTEHLSRRPRVAPCLFCCGVNFRRTAIMDRAS